jgi:hypothetical protein
MGSIREPTPPRKPLGRLLDAVRAYAAAQTDAQPLSVSIRLADGSRIVHHLPPAAAAAPPPAPRTSPQHQQNDRRHFADVAGTPAARPGRGRVLAGRARP